MFAMFGLLSDGIPVNCAEARIAPPAHTTVANSTKTVRFIACPPGHRLYCRRACLSSHNFAKRALPVRGHPQPLLQARKLFCRSRPSFLSVFPALGNSRLRLKLPEPL